jgi:hypothetical protein
LIRSFSYAPIPFTRIVPGREGALFAGGDEAHRVAIDYVPGRTPEFSLLDAASARTRIPPVVDAPPPPYSIPQSTYAAFAAARPGRVKNGYREDTKFEERIGPWQLEGGSRLWFGKSFYDGEGNSGIGGFGYFDIANGQLHLVTPPEILDWSVSAILVEPETVWLGLEWDGEFGGPSGGLLRFDRRTNAVSRMVMTDHIAALRRVGERLMMGTDFGIATLDGDRLSRYFVDQTTDGRWRIAEAVR